MDIWTQPWQEAKQRVKGFSFAALKTAPVLVSSLLFIHHKYQKSLTF